MRIIHIQDYFHPQLGYQEAFLPREQAKLGHDVYVVTSDRYKPLVYNGSSRLLGGRRIVGKGFFTEEGIKVWRLKTLFEIPYGIWVRGLEKKIQELKPDIVITHGIVNFLALRIAWLKRKHDNFKLIYDDHGTFDNSSSRLRILYSLFKWTFSKLIQGTADAFVGVGYPSKVFMNRRYGIPLERITIIPLGADDELFRFDAAARQEVRTELSISENDIVFICTGKIVPERRLHLVIEAVKLMEAYNHLKVLLVGSGSQTYIGQMKQDIRTKGLEDRFILHNMVPNKELYKYYSAADAAIWPCKASISMLEAMACSLPIIADDSPNMNEMTYVDNQLIYQGHNPSNLAQQMEKLLDPGFRKEMGRNGRKLIEEKLNWRIIAKQFIELCSQ
ncbi:D-inositol-3-phosphate glycosyltransferase [subsurface metagenome]